MTHRRRNLMPWVGFLFASMLPGCAFTSPRQWAPQGSDRPGTRQATDPATVLASFRADPAPPLASLPTKPAAPEGRPVEEFLGLALAQNPKIRASYFNLKATHHRIAQAMSLEDPVASNTIFPIPMVAPQYSLMGYMPYDLMISQQFPWFGTLRLRGQAAMHDAQVALEELAAVQLDVVEAVKRSFHDVAFTQRALTILDANRLLAVEFLEIARQRFVAGNVTQSDVLRSKLAIDDLDREIEATRKALMEARAELARLIHSDDSQDIIVSSRPFRRDIPADLDRLAALATASRPELRGRLAAVARDQQGVALALKKYYPNVSLGLVYQDMEKTNAATPKTASGMPNVGLVVGFNLPVYRQKLQAGVSEAQARVAAGTMEYHAERDRVLRDVKALFAEVQATRNILEILSERNLPTGRQLLESAASDYRAGNSDYLSLVTYWRELLGIELQVASTEADLGKSFASLERAVGVELSLLPPVDHPSPSEVKAEAPPSPPAPVASDPS